ncbi:carbon-nitrogen hydrolase family protein [Bacillus sp. AGMB 02131]|uniref:Carbon-nitrogen hydrolase family protein n=1 Tax=Peribacillus faecalis TaxID=2772559 RepID=A0A927CX62_9BACI|nr:carbon-nitrogen hydrolase family protein [Peribacillus faecalis]MBD3108701.1 carbon-nitrogen hydrolase family protein [Peribacillus faecalis]
MRIFALQLNNDLKGIETRKNYIESLIAKLDSPDFVVLPELAFCSYIGNETIWQYADVESKDTSQWAMKIADKYKTYIGVGYLEKEGNDYYNSYMIADGSRVYGIVRKCEGESYIFKRGDFGHIIAMPFGHVAVGICYDAHRKHFYDNIRDHEISLILFPHGAPSDPKKQAQERAVIDYMCQTYAEAYHVPVVYVNSVGKLDPMLGLTGKLMAKEGFVLNGLSKIYHFEGEELSSSVQEVIGLEAQLADKKRCGTIKFQGNDLIKGNFLFRKLILPKDIRDGVRFYKAKK